MIDLLHYYHIKPICVFDGRYVGRKGDTLEKRKKAKEENRQRGFEYLTAGNEGEARKYLSRCIIIDEKIISRVMKALYTKDVEYIVAPYESDSQMAKLVKLGIADFAITEDSDLIIYDVRVMLKLGQDGECSYVDLQKWSPDEADNIYLREFLKMSPEGRVEAAILAGSDYNNSIKGIGIKKAIRNLSEHKDMNSVIKALRQKKTFIDRVPEDYENVTLSSKLIFTFATVFNPFNNALEFLHP